MHHDSSSPNEYDMNVPYRQRLTHKERNAKRRSKYIKKLIPIVFVLAVIIVGGIFLLGNRNDESKADQSKPSEDAFLNNVIPPSPSAPTPEAAPVEEEQEETPFLHETSQTVFLDDEFPSEYVFLIDAQTGEILAEKNSYVFMNPASMTKVLTLLVAAENIEDTTGTFTMTQEISEYCFVNECSVVGYIVGETVPVEELFYGCILSSGADASLALAELAAGSHEEFVKRMNEKLVELGLSDTAYFTNCVGLYDKLHGCTTADMALIMKAALENEKCKEVLCTKVYYSAATEEHPEGQVLSNWFVRSVEDKDNGEVKVLGGKRGYVPQSGNCAVSYGETENGKSYICVTGNAYSQKQAIYDHAALYKEYCHS